MKKRSIWLLVAAAIAAIALSFAWMNDKVSVNASSVALAEQGWRANFFFSARSGSHRTGRFVLDGRKRGTG
nr:hypothetical protein [Planococcus glaciei]